VAQGAVSGCVFFCVGWLGCYGGFAVCVVCRGVPRLDSSVGTNRALWLWTHFFLLVQECVCWYTREVYDGDRSERVALRVSLVEKELWVQAAGGSRRLSDWIRERLNSAVTERDSAEVGDAPAEPVVVAPLPPRSVTAETCPAKDNHTAGQKCLRCQTTFPPARVVKSDFKSDWKPGMKI